MVTSSWTFIFFSQNSAIAVAITGSFIVSIAHHFSQLCFHILDNNSNDLVTSLAVQLYTI